MLIQKSQKNEKPSKIQIHLRNFRRLKVSKNIITFKRLKRLNYIKGTNSFKKILEG